MITIKHSLIELLQTENLTVKCAKSTYGNTFYDEEETELTFNLKIGYNEIDFNAFLEFLNQQNDGWYDVTIWLNDGTWIDYDYDYDSFYACGHWSHIVTPTIPENLK